MYRILFTFTLMAFPISAFSGGWTGADGQKISSIIIEGSDTAGTALILMEGGVDAGNIPSGCNSVYNVISLSEDRGRAMLAMALAAKLSDKPVRLALGACYGARPLVTNLWLL
jgi:hypothetical protein